jgi:hypothetical protein
MRFKNKKIHVKKEITFETDLPIYTVLSVDDLTNIVVKRGVEFYIKCEKQSILEHLPSCFQVMSKHKKIFYRVYKKS